jgi:hypothetical protein
MLDQEQWAQRTTLIRIRGKTKQDAPRIWAELKDQMERPVEMFFLILKHVFGFKIQRWNQTEINLNKLFGGFSILELSKLV